MSEKNSTQIIISSALATTITAVFTNPLEVIKVRMQNTAKVSSISSFSHFSHLRAAMSPIKLNA